MMWNGGERKDKSPAHTRDHCLESGGKHCHRDMKEAVKQAANSVHLFQVDGQCLTSAKFEMRELDCRQKRARRVSQQKRRECS